MYLKTIAKILMGFLLISSLNAQKSNINKANEVFEAYSYIDAREIYLNVVKEGFESPQVFQKLGDTYYFNSEYSDALVWYQKLMEKYPNGVPPVYYYRTAQSLKSTGKYQESKKMMGQFASLSADTELAKNFMNDYPTLDSLVDFKSKEFEVYNVTELLTNSDFGPSFYGEDKLVYASASGNTIGDQTHDWSGLPYLDLYEAQLDKEWRLTKPKPLEGEINTPYHEASATFTKDGKTVYFTRNNYKNGRKRKNKDKLTNLKVYKAIKLDDGSWGNVEELPFNDNSSSIAHPALSHDEKRLYFSSNMEGTIGESDIWYVDILGDGNYGAPTNLGTKINTEAREAFPFLSESNNLYFSSDGHLGLGGLDIFVISLNEDGAYKEVTNLKQPINSNKDDFGFIIKEEKKMGFMSSNRDGNEGSISDDIYRIWEICGEIVIQGVISNAKTGEAIKNATVQLLNKNERVVSETKTDEQGNYRFGDFLNCTEKYTINATYRDYGSNQKSLTTPRGSDVVQTDLELTPPECPVDDLGCRLTLQPIYFDYGKHNIRPDAEVELAKILQALKEYPELKIHIESHTDSRSSSSFNLGLSERRARATMQWFIEKGIARNRLTAKGYGESMLLNHCANGVQCSDDEHELNRRSMFIIKN
ncbi:OmpA family protein [Muricauda oceani]|uniref:OmpA family protein n=1 Tax=Flagellimonas oceani TaxID=2698672 RepID=A0A6G7J1F6_9FLAO|nr:OmpA family protein [Allomuricauda oceani]MBW8241574.1 OmpA family protein [Allomuricauda oceani]QII44438.1 OmpA family protein [Allomuricauda oceani]